jgi:hypothetical protein
MPVKAVCVLNGEVVKGTLFFDQDVSFLLSNSCAKYSCIPIHLAYQHFMVVVRVGGSPYWQVKLISNVITFCTKCHVQLTRKIAKHNLLS